MERREVKGMEVVTKSLWGGKLMGGERRGKGGGTWEAGKRRGADVNVASIGEWETALGPTRVTGLSPL